MKVLLTGANGQIGQEFCSQAKPQAAFDLHAYTHRDLDIRDAQKVDRIIHTLKPDIVINAAAYTAVDQAEAEPELAFAVNETGAENLAIACLKHGCKLIQLSTDFVFDGTKIGAYIETDEVNPIGIYAKSKAAGEQAVQKTLPSHIILRTSWVYSPYGQNFMRTMLRLMNKNSELRVVNDQYGSPTAAADIAVALSSLCEQWADNEEVMGTFHYSGLGQASWYDFAYAIGEQFSKTTQRKVNILPISSADYPTAARRPMNSLLDCKRIAKTFGIHAIEWQKATAREVKRYLEWQENIA